MRYLFRLENTLKYFTAVVLLAFSMVNVSYAATVSGEYLVRMARPMSQITQALQNPVGYVLTQALFPYQNPVPPAELEPSDLDTFLRYIADRRLKGYVEHIVKVREFLQVSEPILSPELTIEESGRRERDLVLGFLIIWLSENPKNMLRQLGGGPAVGVLQIEPITAIDHLKRATQKSPGNPQHILAKEVISALDPDGKIARQIEVAGFERADEDWMRGLLIKHPVLQHLVWRLFIENRADEIPQTREGWSQFHANFWNTAYWCDLEESNAQTHDLLCRNPRLGLAIPHKTKMMSRLVGHWMLSPMSANTVVEKQWKLTRSIRSKMKDTGRIFDVYRHLTRALREVRNTELALNKLEPQLRPDPTEDIKGRLRGYLDDLNRLNRPKGHVYSARRETDHLALYYKPHGLSQDQWDAEIEELNAAISTLESGIGRLKTVINGYLAF